MFQSVTRIEKLVPQIFQRLFFDIPLLLFLPVQFAHQGRPVIRNEW